MATKKKKTSSATDLLPSLGDSVIVISATIFDNSETLSDLLATGVVTAVNPAAGWDYEVTFSGELSLKGREKIKSRLYNKHQIAKNTNMSSIPNVMNSGIYEALNEESAAIYDYNQTIRCLKDLTSRIASEKRPERLADMIAQRERCVLALVDKEKRAKDARKRLAEEIRLLLVENPDDKTPD